MFFFFFKQKTAYEMRISDWSSDVCSSDLLVESAQKRRRCDAGSVDRLTEFQHGRGGCARRAGPRILPVYRGDAGQNRHWLRYCLRQSGDSQVIVRSRVPRARSEEHTSELQSLMRISYAVFCLKKKKTTTPSN